jgi:hypothetical protein
MFLGALNKMIFLDLIWVLCGSHGKFLGSAPNFVVVFLYSMVQQLHFTFCMALKHMACRVKATVDNADKI